jgi:hypothetical protein
MAKKTDTTSEAAPTRKQHRKKREKVAKKHQFKKNKKKFYDKRKVLREIKQHKDDLRKLGFLTKPFSEKVHADELLSVQKMLGKLLQHDSNAEKDLIQLFQ